MERLRERAQAFSDKVVQAEAFSVDDRTGNLLLCSSPKASDCSPTNPPVPISYLTRCPPDLRAINLNHWLRKEGGRNFFLRFDGWSATGS